MPAPAGPRPRQNPFEYGRELDRDELVDREEELRQVTRALENGGKLFLIGPRRYGKTSLLRAAEMTVAAKGVLVLRFDAERYESLDLLAAALLTAATRGLESTIERAGALLRRAAARLQPEVKYDLREQKFSVHLGVAGSPAKGDLPVLVDTLDAIERMASASRRPVVVIIDEFQQVVVQGGEAAEKQLRAAVQRHRKVGYVFAGSATRLLADMTGDAGRAFYKLGARLFLGAIPRAEFTPFLRRGFRQAAIAVDADALTRLLDVADDVPYTVQRLAHECWEMLRVTRSERRLSVAAVDTALTRVLRQEDAAYTQVWNSLTLQQKRALKAVLLESGRALLSAAVTARYRIPTPSMQRALGALDARGIVREEQDAGAIRYRLEDPMLGHWLRWSQQMEAP